MLAVLVRKKRELLMTLQSMSRGDAVHLHVLHKAAGFAVGASESDQNRVLCLEHGFVLDFLTGQSTPGRNFQDESQLCNVSLRRTRK